MRIVGRIVTEKCLCVCVCVCERERERRCSCQTVKTFVSKFVCGHSTKTFEPQGFLAILPCECFMY